MQSILLVCPTIYSAGCKLLIVFGQNRLRLDFISGAFFFYAPFFSTPTTSKYSIISSGKRHSANSIYGFFFMAFLACSFRQRYGFYFTDTAFLLCAGIIFISHTQLFYYAPIYVLPCLRKGGITKKIIEHSITFFCSASGNRTRVSTVRGLRARPLH